MKVIIDISKDLYKRIFDGEIALNTDDKWELEESVRLSVMHGKVLPKTHGRLIDADTFENFIRKDWDKNDHWIADVVYSRPTIIPASEEHTMEEFMYGQEGNPNDGSM